MKKKITLKNFIIILLLICSVYTVVNQQIRMQKIKKQVTNEQNRLNTLKKENQKLQDEVNLSKTDRYMEKLARERLGYVKPNETPVINSEAK